MQFRTMFKELSTLFFKRTACLRSFRLKSDDTAVAAYKEKWAKKIQELEARNPTRKARSYSAESRDYPVHQNRHREQG